MRPRSIISEIRFVFLRLVDLRQLLLPVSDGLVWKTRVLDPIVMNGLGKGCDDRWNEGSVHKRLDIPFSFLPSLVLIFEFSLLLFQDYIVTHHLTLLPRPKCLLPFFCRSEKSFSFSLAVHQLHPWDVSYLMRA